jgi:hypothetical protein
MLFVPERSPLEATGKNAVGGQAVVGPIGRQGKDPKEICIPKRMTTVKREMVGDKKHRRS